MPHNWYDIDPFKLVLFHNYKTQGYREKVKIIFYLTQCLISWKDLEFNSHILLNIHWNPAKLKRCGQHLQVVFGLICAVMFLMMIKEFPEFVVLI